MKLPLSLKSLRRPVGSGLMAIESRLREPGRPFNTDGRSPKAPMLRRNLTKMCYARG